MRISVENLLQRGGARKSAALCVIASEGDVTEPQYLEALKANRVYDSTRVHVEILPHLAPGCSAPNWVSQQLDEFKKKYHLRDFDTLWLLIDHDRWPPQSFRQVAQHAGRAGYTLCLSYPSFELWLLLHFVERESQIESVETSPKCEAALRDLLGSYNKTKLPIERFQRARVEAAVSLARKMDEGSEKGWPQKPGSRVYLLIEHLFWLEAR